METENNNQHHKMTAKDFFSVLLILLSFTGFAQNKLDTVNNLSYYTIINATDLGVDHLTHDASLEVILLLYLIDWKHDISSDTFTFERYRSPISYSRVKVVGIDSTGAVTSTFYPDINGKINISIDTECIKFLSVYDRINPGFFYPINITTEKLIGKHSEMIFNLYRNNNDYQPKKAQRSYKH